MGQVHRRTAHELVKEHLMSREGQGEAGAPPMPTPAQARQLIAYKLQIKRHIGHATEALDAGNIAAARLALKEADKRLNLIQMLGGKIVKGDST